MQALLAKNYADDSLKSFMINNTAGMADATGVSTSIQFIAKRAADPSVKPEDVMPPARGLTDFMVVWDQKNREAKWGTNRDQNGKPTGFATGGGQWNGNIPIPIYRNMAAQLTLGLAKNTDVRVSVFARALLHNMPSPPYPFPVDMEKAKKGEELYAKNCGVCHKPGNVKTYDLGTNMSRTQVVNGAVAKSARQNLFAFCNPQTTLKLPPRNEEIKPCETYDGVSLENMSQFTILDGTERPGIQARVLSGLWAQAPYLNGGSVPTLKHILIPNSRPKKFRKSVLEYDTVNVGFKWNGAENSIEPSATTEGVEYDTSVFENKQAELGNPTSTKGHDQNGVEEGQSYRLDWSGAEEDAMNLIEYMKTL